MVSKESREAAELNKGKTHVVIDVTKSGYLSVSNGGKLPNIPIVVKAKYFTDGAKKKIEEVGGGCVIIP